MEKNEREIDRERDYIQRERNLIKNKRLERKRER
jgi:hypothetical protein